jgi:hypothetical protein
VYQKEINREAKQESNPVTEYRLAEIHMEEQHPELHLYTFKQLGDWMSEIVKVESPIHFDEMTKRIVEAAGLSKAGSRIRYTITQALKSTELAGQVLVKDEFIWDPEMKVPTVRDRSKLPAAYKKLSLIAPEEIHEAIRQVVSGSISITEEETIPLVAKSLGFARVTDEMRQALSESIGQAIRHNIITHEGVNLKMHS